MKKEEGNVLSIVLVIVIIVLIVAGGIFLVMNTQKNEETSSKTNSKQVSIEDFKMALQNKNIIITEETKKSATMIGAEEGYGYEINGQSIEIYKFDEKSNIELTKNNIKSAKENGIVTMPDFNNMTFNVKYNKGLVLLNYEQHSNKEEILEVFNNL